MFAHTFSRFRVFGLRFRILSLGILVMAGSLEQKSSAQIPNPVVVNNLEAVSFSPDGALAEIGPFLWDVRQAALKRLATPEFRSGFGFGASNFGMSIRSPFFSTNGKTLLSLYTTAHRRAHAGIVAMDAQTGKEKHVAYGEDYSAVSSNGKIGLTGGAAGDRVQVWDMETGTQTTTVPAGYPFVLSPDGKTLASVGEEGAVTLYDLNTGAVRRTLAGDRGSIQQLAFSPNGRTLAKVSKQTEVQLWDTQTGTNLRVLSAAPMLMDAVAFSPDGKLVAAGGQDFPRLGQGRATVRLWETETGRLRGVLEAGVQATLSRLVFSPDGKLLIGSPQLDRVQGSPLFLWQLQTGALQRTYGGVIASAFAPNTKTLIATYADGRAEFCEARTGKLRATLVFALDWKLTKEQPTSGFGYSPPPSEAVPYWIAYTPEGDYLTSQNDAQLPRWFLNSKLLPSEGAARAQSQPNRVRKALALD